MNELKRRNYHCKVSVLKFVFGGDAEFSLGPKILGPKLVLAHSWLWQIGFPIHVCIDAG